MYEVVILSGITHVTKSLTALINAEDDLYVISVTEDISDVADDYLSLRHRVIIVDIEFPEINNFLGKYANRHKVLLYSHSRDSSEINKILNEYKINFFNVYTSPDKIIDLIRKTVN
ncbi:hypothetical protein [Bacillus sp. AK031]